MPGRKSAHSAPVALKLAIQLAGSAELLFEGVPDKTREGIERRKLVPAYRVVPFMLAKLSRPAAQSVPDPDAPDLSDMERGMVKEFNAAAKQLVKILKHLKPEEEARALVTLALSNGEKIADARATSRKTKRQAVKKN